ncbi:MAG: thiamine ABC transporter substrate-binding protein [Sphaerochaetaceae bacterium]|jgi:thiamine transport system substrate-binding protein
MNKHPRLFAVLAIVLCFAALSAQPMQEENNAGNVLTVYASNSFCGEWGAGPTLVKKFQEKTGKKVQLIASGDTGEMLTKLISEKNNPKADVVVGIPLSMATKAYQSDLFASYDSPVLSDIPTFLQFDRAHRLLPYDYGNFAFVYDTEKISADMIPHSLQDLTNPKYKGKVILIDPRTSSVGQGLLLWTIEVFGEDHFMDWWKAMKANALTIADGWSSGYGLFTSGEAPIVISYTTSPVYHVAFENTTRYQTLIFPEGHDTTIEGVGMLQSSRHQDTAKQFIDFMLSDEQIDIAMTNSMYPANANVTLPKAFAYAPKPQKDLTIDPATIEKKMDTWLTLWEQEMNSK